MSKHPDKRPAVPVAGYQDLLVWQRSMDLVEQVYRLTARLPAAEQWGS